MNVEPETRALENIRFFPWLRVSTVRHDKDLVQEWIRATWILLLLRNSIEDIEGADGRELYLKALWFVFIDEVVKADCFYSGRATPDKMHRLALAMENGLTDVACLPGDALVAYFWPTGATGNEVAKRMLAFWEALLTAYPGKLPDLLEPGQTQRRALRCFRDWSKLCKAAETDDTFMSKFSV